MAEERLDEIRKIRLEKRQSLIDDGREPYPAETRRSHTVSEALESFDGLIKDKTPITMVGRLMSIRSHGSIVFMDLEDATGKLQIQFTKDGVTEEIFKRIESVDTGDFIQVAGTAIKTERGVETLLVDEFHLLSKSIRPLPSTWFGLKDSEKRYRQRELDLLINKEGRDILVLRSKVLGWLRAELAKEGYLEVETPILQQIAGGAVARPFKTHHNTLDTDLYLRIAPELYLKRLLVAGFEKVFDMGRCFRNEGVDREHNPEFTMCELYWAYADYEDLMELTEQMISKMVRDITGGEEVKCGEETISFGMPWKRIRFIDLMNDELGVDILEEKDESKYVKIMEDTGLEVPKVRTYAKLIDELYKELVRPKIIQPTILYDYPTELVPLAKQNATDKRVAEKFQLLIKGTEVINAYTEQNDPVEQSNKFKEQQKDRKKGDDEVGDIDEDYIRALEHGMPPAAGWGLGVDRLVAVLGDAHNVRDTIAFPLLRPEK
jgi:lysyl-tRNA synthetase, class II